MNAQSEPPKSFFDSLRNSTAVRPRERWIGGVSGAIQARTGFDLALIRGLFIVAGFFGIGFVAYGLAWAFLPEKDTGQIVAEDISRGKLTGALFGAGAFVFIGLWTPFNFAGWVFGGNLLVIPSWIGIIIVAIVMLATVTRQSRNTAPVPPPSMPPTEPIVPPAPPHSESYTHAVPTHAAPRTQTAQTEQTVQTEQSAQTEQTAQTEQLAQTAPIAQGESWAPPPARDERFSRGKEESAREKAARKSHRPSKALVSAVIGLALIAAAIAALADLGATQWWVPVAGVAVIVLGLGIVVAGLAGKSSSVLSPLALLTLGATLIASLGWITTGQLIGEITWTPSAVSQDIDQGRVVGVGSLTADLRDVPLDTSVTEIPLRFGVGDVEIIVPDNRRVVVETAVSVGGISIESASNSQGGIPMVGSGTFVLGEEFSEDETLTVSVMGLVGDVSVTTAAPTTMEVTNE